MNGFVRDETIAHARNDVASQQAALLAAERALADARDPIASEKAQHAVALAKKGLRAAEAEQAAAMAKIAADIARYASPVDPNAPKLIHAAARLDRKRVLLQAEAALLKAELADFEAKNAAKQPGKNKAAPADTATPLKQARSCRGRSQVERRRRTELCTAYGCLPRHQHRPPASAGSLDHPS